MAAAESYLPTEVEKRVNLFDFHQGERDGEDAGTPRFPNPSAYCERRCGNLYGCCNDNGIDGGCGALCEPWPITVVSYRRNDFPLAFEQPPLPDDINPDRGDRRTNSKRCLCSLDYRCGAIHKVLMTGTTHPSLGECLL